jgi:DNA-binding NtrC family response regulator
MSTSIAAESKRSDTAAPPPASKKKGGVLIVEDEPPMRAFLERTLSRHFERVESAGNAEEARVLAKEPWFDVLIADVHLPGTTTGDQLVRALRDLHASDFEVILMTGYPDVPRRVSDLKQPSAQIIRKPFAVAELDNLIARAKSRNKEPEAADARPAESSIDSATKYVTDPSGPMCTIWDAVRRLAPMPTTVLIRGETGTGKEVIARALHELSGRRGAYVPVNCGAITAELIESELFGHARGSFTGAHQRRTGLFGTAEGGTLFLDEIGEMPLPMQAKLLRVLEERRYRPVGSSQEVMADARIVAATNRDLSAEVRSGRFRKDLFYRLNVVDLALPPLRERISDIRPLTEFFLRSVSDELSIPKPELTPDDLWHLERYDWPGNCRELRNVVERALLFGQPLANYIGEGAEAPNDEGPPPSVNDSSLEAVERLHILSALAAVDGNKSVAARALGISRKTIERKLKEWSARGLLDDAM